MTERKTATREEWLTARAELLPREKELTRMSDELARQRQELPWVPVEKKYTFQTADGSKTLAELFEGRSQLAVYHFMFGPSYETCLHELLVDREIQYGLSNRAAGSGASPRTRLCRVSRSEGERITSRASDRRSVTGAASRAHCAQARA
jgi:hypothetical protein